MRCTDCYGTGPLVIGGRFLCGEYQIAVTNEDSVDVAVATLSCEEMEGLGLKLIQLESTRLPLRYGDLVVDLCWGARFSFRYAPTALDVDADDAESFGIDLIRLTARAA